MSTKYPKYQFDHNARKEQRMDTIKRVREGMTIEDERGKRFTVSVVLHRPRPMFGTEAVCVDESGEKSRIDCATIRMFFKKVTL